MKTSHFFLVSLFVYPLQTKEKGNGIRSVRNVQDLDKQKLMYKCFYHFSACCPFGERTLILKRLL